MKGITPRQQEILEYLEGFIATNQYSPSYREMMEKFGFSSLGTVYKHLKVLQRKGLITAEKKCSRSVALTREKPKELISTEVELPLMGRFHAKGPIETYSQIQTFPVPRRLVHDPDITYLVRAQGEGLSEELIADDDLVVVEARQDANQGDTVLALIHGHEAVIKRYYPEGHYVRLESSSPNHSPIIVRYDDFSIQGVVIALLRHYSVAR